MTDVEKRANNASGQEAVARLMDRRGFLKALAAAGAGAAIGSNALLRETLAQNAPPSRGSFKPTDLTFSIEEKYRPVSLLAENFVELSDGFDTLASAANYRTLRPAPEDDAGNASFGGGALQVSGDSYFALFRSDTVQRAPYSAVIVDVERFAGSGGEQDTVYAGLVKDEGNYLVAWYNNTTKKVGVDLVVDGEARPVRPAPSNDADLADPVRFAFTLVSDHVVVYADSGDGWDYLFNGDNFNEHLDLRDPAVLAEYRNGFGARASSGTIVLDVMEAGYFGRLGVRDPDIVTWSDGTPYIEDNKLYLTQTNAGFNEIRCAHYAVYTLDLDDYTKLEEVGKIFFDRDGLVLGDHAGHIVFDPSSRSFRIVVSTWGDWGRGGAPVKVAYANVERDILRGVSVIESERILLNAAYDPYPVRIEGRWWMAYTIQATSPDVNNGTPVLGRFEGKDFTNFVIVGQDAEHGFYEGTKLQKVGGNWYVFASGTSELGSRDDYRIYDLDMRFIGNLNAPHPTAVPHPMVTPIPTGDGRTRWIMVTFDGTRYPGEFADSERGPFPPKTRGDFYVMEAAEVTRGYEFPPRPVP